MVTVRAHTDRHQLPVPRLDRPNAQPAPNAPAGDEAVPPVRADRDDDGPHTEALKAKRATFQGRPLV